MTLPDLPQRSAELGDENAQFVAANVARLVLEGLQSKLDSVLEAQLSALRACMLDLADKSCGRPGSPTLGGSSRAMKVPASAAAAAAASTDASSALSPPDSPKRRVERASTAEASLSRSRTNSLMGLHRSGSNRVSKHRGSSELKAEAAKAASYWQKHLQLVRGAMSPAAASQRKSDPSALPFGRRRSSSGRRSRRTGSTNSLFGSPRRAEMANLKELELHRAEDLLDTLLDAAPLRVSKSASIQSASREGSRRASESCGSAVFPVAKSSSVQSISVQSASAAGSRRDHADYGLAVTSEQELPNLLGRKAAGEVCSVVATGPADGAETGQLPSHVQASEEAQSPGAAEQGHLELQAPAFRHGGRVSLGSCSCELRSVTSSVAAADLVGRPSRVLGHFSSLPESNTRRRLTNFTSMQSLRMYRNRSLLDRSLGIAIDGDEAAQQEVFVMEELEDEEEEEVQIMCWPVLLLRLTGVLPWSFNVVGAGVCEWRPAAWYQRAVLAVLLLSFAGSMSLHLLPSATREGCAKLHEDCGLQRGLLSDLPVFAGSFTALITLGAYKSDDDVYLCIQKVMDFAYYHGFQGVWSAVTLRHFATISVLWICALCARIAVSSGFSGDVFGVAGVVMFAIASWVLTAVAFCQMYVVSALTAMVESFCRKVYMQPDLEDAVRQWDVVQAMLRKTSFALEHCFFVLQTVTFSVLLCAMSDAVHGGHSPWKLLPSSLLILVLLRTFLAAGAVTDRCARVPSLVNALSFGSDIDPGRQCVVDYIVQSAAGFYVFEVPVTCAMALKFAYLGGVVAFGLVTNANP
eukprot:TRINITY_DN59648_c0_g1_i1.p1 TRINITY_DN59648_c0_g1~~TRINITY_DN59648_c0_g1_i1.p1  ORF type:complete len:806 (-),score=129.56 TRINITY_DN59648_c0_g1_i1:80-2497(-)